MEDIIDDTIRCKSHKHLILDGGVGHASEYWILHIRVEFVPYEMDIMLSFALLLQRAYWIYRQAQRDLREVRTCFTL